MYDYVRAVCFLMSICFAIWEILSEYVCLSVCLSVFLSFCLSLVNLCSVIFYLLIFVLIWWALAFLVARHCALLGRPTLVGKAFTYENFFFFFFINPPYSAAMQWMTIKGNSEVGLKNWYRDLAYRPLIFTGVKRCKIWLLNDYFSRILKLQVTNSRSMFIMF